MRHSIVCLLPLLLVLMAPFAGRAGDDRCTIPAQDDNPVVKACARGGRTEAKRLMKEMVKDAKARGVKFKCEDCHKDLDNWELTPNARADLKKLLEAVAKK